MNIKALIKKYWSDPVWSKVIANVIIVISASILSLLYLLIQKAYNGIDFLSSITNIKDFLISSTKINNIIIIFSTTYLIYFSVRSIIISSKSNLKKENIKDEKLQHLNLSSTEFFSDRLAKAFPGQRGLQWYDDPKLITDRLSIFFSHPIVFDEASSDKREEISSIPFWWFRKYQNGQITEFEKLSKSKILIGINELSVNRIAVNVSENYRRNFIYLEANGENPTGVVHEYNLKEFNNDNRPYIAEEYGLYNNKPITRNEFDDGAAIIDGKAVTISGAKLRKRFLTKYNFLISAKFSPYNSKQHDNISNEFMDEILKGNKNVEDYFNEISLLPVDIFNT